jgi:hypothetical protein
MASDRGLDAASATNVFSFLAIPVQGHGTPAILAGTSRGLYVSQDGGESWSPRSAGIGDTRVISLARDPLAPTDLFAGADTGVYVSRDAGATWRPLGFGLPAEQHVGVVGVVHAHGGERTIVAAVDQLYRYPGQWLLATEPWRALGMVAVSMLLVAFVALGVWRIRIMATS